MSADTSGTSQDARVAWVLSRVERAFAGSGGGGAAAREKAAKQLRDPESLARLDTFLNDGAARVLTYYGDALTSVLGLPKKLPRGASARRGAVSRAQSVAQRLRARARGALQPCPPPLPPIHPNQARRAF